jgi:hypothetical protein
MEDETGGTCNTHGNNRNACTVLADKPEGKKTYGERIDRKIIKNGYKRNKKGF